MASRSGKRRGITCAGHCDLEGVALLTTNVGAPFAAANLAVSVMLT